ncbi:enoyl-CoA hydratase-related protein [Knoellia locipacati]|uniref:enoyl-CoA hydratase/isomerase family protein n=1 Tax=Knoellia locipacati TaxID=882824 RepID=UPI0038515385
MDDRTLIANRVDGILTLTLNRPERKNALDDSTIQHLQDELRVARDDVGIKALVVTGAGGDFCSGADVGAERRPGHPVDRMRWFGDTALLLHEMPKPVIAKVSGVAVGAGCNLAIAADVVVATPDARFSEIFSRRGLSVDFGGTWLLPRVVGLQQAKRLALLAEIVDAEEAHRIGLVTWVKEAAEIDGFVDDLARRFCQGPPVALAQTKAMLDQSSAIGFRDALDNEARAAAINLATDALEARRAFVEKREPTFDGGWLLDPVAAHTTT